MNEKTIAAIALSNRDYASLDAKLAQARTGIVISRRAFELRVDLLHFQHVSQKTDQLIAPPRQILRALLPARVGGEEPRIMHPQHAGTRAGRRDHVIVLFKGSDDASRQGARVFEVAAVIGRLTATGLGLRDLDLAAGLLQQLDGSKADIRAPQIDETSHEQADVGSLESIPRLLIVHSVRHSARARGAQVYHRHATAIRVDAAVDAHGATPPHLARFLARDTADAEEGLLSVNRAL